MKKSEKKSRRARGTGSVRWDAGRKLWVGRQPVGVGRTGRTRYREVSARTQAECVRLKAELAPAGPGTTLRAWAARWLKGVSVRPGTRDRVANELRHVVEALGRHRVADLRASHVRAFTAEMVAAWSPGFARNVAGVLRQLLDAAVAEELVARNVAKLVPKPRVPPAQLDVYTPEQLKVLIAAHDRSHCGPVVALLGATGCRIGEAAALDVADYKGGRVSITKTFSHRHGLGPPKTHRGRRVITVPVKARPAVEAAIAGRTEGVLFPRPSGNRYTSSTLTAVIGGHFRKLGLPVRKVHALRHAVATALVAAGWSLADVAEFLGDSVTTIVATYCHPTGADPAVCLDRLFA